MYHLIHEGKILQFHYFVDAWLHAILELKSFSKITGPDGEWTVNPPKAN